MGLTSGNSGLLILPDHGLPRGCFRQAQMLRRQWLRAKGFIRIRQRFMRGAGGYQSRQRVLQINHCLLPPPHSRQNLPARFAEIRLLGKFLDH